MTGSARMARAALAHAQPVSALLELTYRCNWRCAFCYNPRHSDRKPLSAAEWSAVFDGLRELGTLTVTLTGGEPLARRDFFDIARSARDRSFALRIFTNGSLVDDEAASRIAALSPLAVELSLHGARAETHDRVTGRPGSFDAMLGGLDRLRAHGVRTLLKTPMSRWNEDEIDGMLAIARERGVPYLLDVTITPRDGGDLSPLAHAASRGAIRRVMEKPEFSNLISAQNRQPGHVNCGLGRLAVAVDPEGNVFPCPQWRHQALGNVRDTPIAELWRGSEIRKDAAAVATAANDAMIGAGPELAAVPFCPAVAFEYSRNPLAPDPATRRRAELAAQVRRSLPAR